MILHSVPDPELTRDGLHTATTAIWAALEYGLSKTREYFDDEGTEIDPWLAANITRYHARLYLDAHQLDGDYQRIDLLNCGLRLMALRGDYYFDVWIRKSDDGELPVPKSESMIAFYYQPLLPEVFQDEPAAAPAANTISLVVLWETPASYTHLTSLALVCPAQGGESKADVQEHWTIPIPHPTSTAQAITPPPGAEEPADDLDIEDDADEASGGGSGS